MNPSLPAGKFSREISGSHENNCGYAGPQKHTPATSIPSPHQHIRGCDAVWEPVPASPRDRFSVLHTSAADARRWKMLIPVSSLTQ